MTQTPSQRPLLRGSFRAALLFLAFAGAPSFAEPSRAILPSPVPAAEKLLGSKLPPTLDGKVLFAYRVARAEAHPEGDVHPLLGTSVTPDGLKMTARFKSDVTSSHVGALAEVGCEVVRLDTGIIAAVGPVVEAWCSWDALMPLARIPGLIRASPTLGYRIHRPVPPPESNTAKDVEITALRTAMHPGGGRGEGVVVADMDSGFDPFHPFLFRADGGAYEWLDLDGNGAFDPLVDAVDFNRNRFADAGEALGMIKAAIFSHYTSPHPFNDDGPFVPGVDWLFQDENANGRRDQGPVAPYGDAKPTFGEQLFVADDVDGDGVLETNERVIALKTHKVKAALSPVTLRGSPRTFRRGENLAQISWPYDDDEMHGTMVLGTIAGGDPRYMRYAGMAPDAELLLASSRTEDLVSTLAWAKSEGARIVLWEMATWYMEFLDGSSNHEVACDAAMDEGVLQIGAAGNLGTSLKHRVKTHATGTEEVPLIIPGGQAQYVLGNFNWRDATGPLSFSLNVNGVKVELSGSQGVKQAGNAYVEWQSDESTRGTKMLIFYIVVAQQSSVIPGQTATFEVTNAGEPVALHGYVTDDFTSWSRGVYWPESAGGTDLGTYGTPGTGDKTLSVGTSFLDFVPTFNGDVSGALARHSGQGPRIDGLDTVDIVAPEDHITSAAGLPGVKFGDLMVGGGTSNASPMVTGIAAALLGLDPTQSAFQIRDRIFQNAQVEAQMGPVPNDQWGHGKIRAYRAQFSGTLPGQNQAPIAEGTAVRFADGTLKLDASASTDPEHDALRYRWDVDYDGTWDVGPMDAPAAQSFLVDAELPVLKLEVIDAHGASAEVLVPITASNEPSPNPPDAGTDPGTGGNGGGTGPGGNPPGSSGNGNGDDKASGCGCAATGALAWPGLLMLLAFARRRRQ